jgi:excisionase family DNA binding protein
VTELEAAVAKLVDVLRAELRSEVASGPAPEQLLSVDDAAARLGVSRRTLYSQLRRGRGRSVTVARRRLVPASALSEFTDQSEGSTRVQAGRA